MKLSLTSPQMMLLKDLSSCVQPVVDDFTKSVFEEYIDHPLERRKMVTAEKAVTDFEVAVSRARDLITSSEGHSTAEVELAFSKAKDAFNMAATSFNSAVVRFERRTSLYMKCSPLTRGILSPREGRHWDPWADDATSPRRAEFAEMSFVAIIFAVFGLFAMGSLLSSYNIGMPGSSNVQQSISDINMAFRVPNVTEMTSSFSSFMSGGLNTRATARLLTEEFWRQQREEMIFHISKVSRGKDVIGKVSRQGQLHRKAFSKMLIIRKLLWFSQKLHEKHFPGILSECLSSVSMDKSGLLSQAMCPPRQPAKKLFTSREVCGLNESKNQSQLKLLSDFTSRAIWVCSSLTFRPMTSIIMKLSSSLNHFIHSGKRRIL